MILAVDAQYEGDEGRVAGILFEEWTQPRPDLCRTHLLKNVAPYEPGQFFKRELPGILLLVEHLREQVVPQCILVDSYVDLGPDHPGLGRHLYEALGGIPVVGVAKTPFKGAGGTAVYRGQGKKPLIVTAAGVPEEVAARFVLRMHGTYRIPTLLKTVDRLARTGSECDPLE